MYILNIRFSAIPPKYGPLGKMYDAYSFAIIPKMGEVVAGDSASYQYLVESIRLFPKQEALCERIDKAGFSHVSYVNYTGGVVAVHTGFKC
jgi:ubiquinone/menaquinone biosynthesis C-methylase UbiE